MDIGMFWRGHAGLRVRYRILVLWEIILLPLLIKEGVINAVGNGLPRLPILVSTHPYFTQYDSVRFLRLEEALQRNPDSVYFLDLSRAQLTYLPEDLFRFKNLKGLRLRHNPDLKVETALRLLARQLPQLEYLDLSWNRITVLPSVIGELHRLRYLDLSHNKQLRRVPESLSDLPLEVFRCKRCYWLDIETLFVYLSAIPELRAIDLSYCQLFSLPWNAKDLKQVEALSLFGNLIVRLPPSMVEMENLRWLDLRRNPWIRAEQVLPILAEIPQLEVLLLSECDLREWLSVRGFPQLRILALQSNRLQKVSSAICTYSNLEVLLLGTIMLGFRDNQLEKLPACMHRLQRLRMLDVRANRLEVLPSWVWQLPNLEWADFSLNRIATFERYRGEARAPIQVLLLGGNAYTRLPDVICTVDELRVLDISGFYFHPASMKLKTLPACIGNLKHLEVLRIRDQVISRVPRSVTTLVNLRTLDLADNLLKSLPSSIDGLSQLERLILAANELTKLPASLKDLERLRILDLHFNPALTEEDLAILKEMSQLDTLDVRYLPLSAQFVRELRRALPNTVVVFRPVEATVQNPPAWLQRRVLEEGRRLAPSGGGEHQKRKRKKGNPLEPPSGRRLMDEERR